MCNKALEGRARSGSGVRIDIANVGELVVVGISCILEGEGEGADGGDVGELSLY